MPLDPQAKAYLDKAAALKLPRYDQVLPVEARKMFLARRGLAGKPEEVEAIEEQTLPAGFDVRIYRPKPKADDQANSLRGCLVYFHGGGWVLGNLDTIDSPCRALANASGRVVVSVDYRLAPEHKYPVPLEDSFAATKYVMTHADDLGIDPKHVAVGGDSAGGNLAASVCLLARDRERLPNPLDFQLLIYPVVDSACDTKSYQEFAEGFGLTAETMRYFWKQYLPRPDQGREPLASPLRSKDLKGLPPALIATAEYDVLRDEGETYSQHLRAAGVRAELRRFDGLIHGFLTLAGEIDRAKTAAKEIAKGLKEASR